MSSLRKLNFSYIAFVILYFVITQRDMNPNIRLAGCLVLVIFSGYFLYVNLKFLNRKHNKRMSFEIERHPF